MLSPWLCALHLYCTGTIVHRYLPTVLLFDHEHVSMCLTACRDLTVPILSSLRYLHNIGPDSLWSINQLVHT
jgi:hypothetical protein